MLHRKLFIFFSNSIKCHHKIEPCTTLYTHDRPSINYFGRILPCSARKKNVESVVSSVALDIRPESFCDMHRGTSNLAKTFFKLVYATHSLNAFFAKSYIRGNSAILKTVCTINRGMLEKWLCIFCSYCIYFPDFTEQCVSDNEGS